MNQTNILRERRWPTFLVLATVGVILNLILFSGAFYYVITPPNPKVVFEHATGFSWPSNAKIISTRNDRLMTDGEFHIVFSVDDATVSQWLRLQPTAPLPNWQSGPVPTEIGFHCGFGTKRGVGLRRGNVDAEKHYVGDLELVDLLSSDEIVYSALAEGPSSVRWHDGTLLVVDPRTNKVWLSIWNF